MLDRILDFSEGPARLSARTRNLVVERKDAPEVLVPFADIAVIVAAHPQVTFTQSVLAELSTAGGTFITCDTTRLPIGLMLPLQGNSTQVERMALQVGATVPVKKRLWKQVVVAKILAQGEALLDLRDDDAGLPELAARVRSGDPDNLEAQASRRYWTLFFGDPDFRRDRAAPDANRFLNYGYAVLRAVVARAICASGLHPSIGLHHHNRYSGYPLADDLMEPFRVIVDRAVAGLVDRRGPDAPMDPDTKSTIIGALTARFRWEDEARTLFDIVAKVAASLVQVFAGERKRLSLPSPPGFLMPSETVT